MRLQMVSLSLLLSEQMYGNIYITGGCRKMIKDRGNIKWTSLMLTEHREKLRELFNHDSEQKKPELDEQKKEELDFIIKMTLKHNLPIVIYYFENRKEQKIRGFIKEYVPLKELLVISVDKEDKHLNIHSIIDLKTSS